MRHTAYSMNSDDTDHHPLMLPLHAVRALSPVHIPRAQVVIGYPRPWSVQNANFVLSAVRDQPLTPPVGADAATGSAELT